MENLEVGRVYRMRGKFFLCIDSDRLLSAYGGEVKTRGPSSKGNELICQMSVEDLCNVWDITLDVLDAITREYLYPDLKPDPAYNARGAANHARSPKQAFCPPIHKMPDVD